MAITFGGTVFDWSSGSEIALWALTGVFGILFCLTQTFSPLVEKDFGLYPTKLMKRPTLLMLQIAIFMAATGLLVCHSAIVIFFQELHIMTAESGTHVLHPSLFPIYSRKYFSVRSVSIQEHSVDDERREAQL